LIRQRNHRLSLGQLAAIVDPHHLGGIGDTNRPGLLSGSDRRGNDIGEVIFSLDIVGFQIPQRRKNKRGVKQVDPGIDLRNLPLLFAGILLFDNLQHPLSVADHPAITGRIGHLGGQHRDCRLLKPMELLQLL